MTQEFMSFVFLVACHLQYSGTISVHGSGFDVLEVDSDSAVMEKNTSFEYLNSI
jgi:hypothetical protein